jgi:nitrous oxide reductase accessory protein NosL
MKRIPVFLLLFLLSASARAEAPGRTQGRGPVSPAEKDRCPVCGMFVAKFPDFAARIRFADGREAAFDGAKDLFKCLLDLHRYFPGKKASDVVAVWVTDYYRLAAIDGRAAFYVSGSDVYGPMGKELIPFATEADAREFLKDHKGTAVYRFRDVTPAVVRALDE